MCRARSSSPARNPAFQRRLCNNLRMHADRWVDQSLADQVDDQLVELAVEIFTMLADATRVRIVLALKDGELSVNTLAESWASRRPRCRSIWRSCGWPGS